MKELTLSQKSKFLACLSIGLSVTEACKQAGVPRRTVYYWRKEDVSFADAWEDSVSSSIEVLEDHLRKRATDPDDKNSHILLMFLLKKLDPSYRENYKSPEKKAVTKAQEFDFSQDEIDAAQAILIAVSPKNRDPKGE